jgi:uncharacterized iron-regulated protein
MIVTLALLAQIAVAPATSADTTMRAASATPTWTPHRVYDTRTGTFTDLEAMARDLAQADVVMIGEQHDDPGTHAMERAVLEVVGRRHAHVVLALEMFERDVQPTVDGYLAGRLPEDSLMAEGRPWPNYVSDYRPLVEWARAEHWPVIAGNIPRALASAVAKHGLAVIDTLSGEPRRWAAADIACPHDAYFERFAATMREHIPGDDADARDAALERYYQAQCIKDETMAESVVRVRQVSGGAPPLVIHVNGSFHSDAHLGTAARISRRLPDAVVRVISAIPVADLDAITVTPEDAAEGDYMIYTLAPAR